MTRKILLVPLGSFFAASCINLTNILNGNVDVLNLSLFISLGLIVFGFGCVVGIELADWDPMMRKQIVSEQNTKENKQP